MLVMPIVNKNRILHVRITLKNARKVRMSVRFDDAIADDIIVNGNRLSDSPLYRSKELTASLDFVRGHSAVHPHEYVITTREEVHSNRYDVYLVPPPPKKINEALDNLYSSVLLDMRKELPGVSRGRYVSLDTLGFSKYLTDEKLSLLQTILSNEKDSSKWPVLFKKFKIVDLQETLDFLNLFDCKIISDTTILEDELQNMIGTLDKLNTKDSKNLKKYYSIALSNRDIYAKISYIHRLIYQKPYRLIQSKRQIEKQLVMTS